MSCGIEIQFIETIRKDGLVDFSELISTIKKLNEKGMSLKWKPDKIEVGGTTVGYLLYVLKDC